MNKVNLSKVIRHISERYPIEDLYQWNYTINNVKKKQILIFPLENLYQK
jgi:hypothetical protein